MTADIDLLAPERDALADLAASVRAQLDALRSGAVDTFETAAGQTLDAVSALERRRRERERQVTAPDAPLVAPESRAALEARAAEAQAACETLELALSGAVALGRDLIGAMHDGAAPATSTVYTARGTVGPPKS